MVVQLPDGTVQFTFICPQAQHVTIAGDFNGWQSTFAMTRLDEKRWRSRLQLAPGLYQFRYCADGQWFNDYAAFGLEHGPFGLNSVLKVEPARRRPPGAVLRLPGKAAPHQNGEAQLTALPTERTTNEQTFPSQPDPIDNLQKLHHAAMAMAGAA